MYDDLIVNPECDWAIVHKEDPFHFRRTYMLFLGCRTVRGANPPNLVYECKVSYNFQHLDFI